MEIVDYEGGELPITKREDAKEGGYAQVREVLQKFKGLVTDLSFGQWGGQLVDDAGKPRPPREFLEISFTGVDVLASSEELSMDISELWTVRINCSDYKGSFWVEMFLASADKFKVLIPDGLKGKVVTMEKQTLEADDPKYNATGWVIAGIEEAGAKSTAPAKPEAPKPMNLDPMATITELAIGKTEDELKDAIPVALEGHPMLPLAKAGTLTQSLLKEKKLVLVDGKYQKPS